MIDVHGPAAGIAFLPFMLFGMVLGLIALVLPLYVVYDVLVNQRRMTGLEKLLWIVIVLSFNLVGVLAYFLIVRQGDTLLLDELDVGPRDEERRLSELERLQRLHEDGALSDEEFAEEKRRILDA